MDITLLSELYDDDVEAFDFNVGSRQPFRLLAIVAEGAIEYSAFQGNEALEQRRVGLVDFVRVCAEYGAKARQEGCEAILCDNISTKPLFL